MVNESAEEVIKEVDHLALAKKGKAGFDELIAKIIERVEVKYLAKGTVSAATIAKFGERINVTRITHILDGDVDLKTGVMAGGHRAGQANRLAKQGKTFGPNHTEFPESWSDEKILESALMAKSPKNLTNPNVPGYQIFEMIIDNVNVRTIFDPLSQRIITSYPFQI